MLPFIRVQECITEEDSSPFADWFDDLDAHAAAKVNTYLTRLGHGNTSNLKPIKGAFQELVIDWAPVIEFMLEKTETRSSSFWAVGQKRNNKEIFIKQKNFGKNIKKEKRGE